MDKNEKTYKIYLQLQINKTSGQPKHLLNQVDKVKNIFENL